MALSIRAGRKTSRRTPQVELLEHRQLLAAPVIPLPPLTLDISAEPGGIVAGSDGALWFTQSGPGRIGRVTTNGTISEFPIPNGSAMALDNIVAGSDGALWFTERLVGGGAIGRLTTAGAYSAFPLPENTSPVSLAGGPDGNLWISEVRTDPATSLETGLIGKLSPTGSLVEYAVPNPLNFPDSNLPAAITAGSDGALWFLEEVEGNLLTRVTTDGTFTEMPGGNIGSGFSTSALTTGPDGALWITYSTLFGNSGVLRVTTAGVSEPSIGLPNLGSYYSGIGSAGTGSATPTSITTGPDGNVWFTELYKDKTGRVGRITPAGVVTDFPLPAGAGVPGPITSGPDGALWYVNSNQLAVQAGAAGAVTLSVGRISTAGAAVQEAVPPALLPVVGRLNPRSDHGAASYDGITNDRTPAFYGLAQPGATVTLTATVAGEPGRIITLGHVKASRTGAWTVTSRPLADGTYQVFMATSGRGITPSSGTPVIERYSKAGPIVIDTVAPRVVAFSYDPSTRTVGVTIQDEGSGVIAAGLPIELAPTVTKRGTRGTLGLVLIPTNVIVTSDGTIPPEEPVLFSGVINDPHPTPGARYTIRIKASTVTDFAGNALDGEYRGHYPTGNGRPGGDFVITVG